MSLPPRAIALAVALLGLLLIAATEDDGDPSESAGILEPVAALAEGNRLFREGQLDEAIAAYRRGYDPSAVHPTLAYNLGTALHHRGSLAEAILWYRRAGDAPDPWREENLWLARRALGSQVLPPGGVDGLLMPHRGTLRLAAIALAWLGFAILIVFRNAPVWLLILLAVLAAALYAGGVAVERFGARPAVLLADCSTTAGDLPAGTEAWVRPQDDGRYRIAAHSADAVCPAEAVALVEP